MPIGKKAVEEHMIKIIGPQLTPDETIITTLYGSCGLNPWLWRWLNIIGALLVPHYYIAMTDQRVIFQKMNAMSNQPIGAIFSDLNTPVAVTKIRRRFLWSSFRYSSPTLPKPIRLNFHRNRRNSMDQFTRFINSPTAAQTTTGRPTHLIEAEVRRYTAFAAQSEASPTKTLKDLIGQLSVQALSDPPACSLRLR